MYITLTAEERCEAGTGKPGSECFSERAKDSCDQRFLQFLCSHRHQAGSAKRSQHCGSWWRSHRAKHWDSAASGSTGSSRLIFPMEGKKQILIFQVTEAVPVMFKGELFWHSANSATENVKSYLEIPGTRGRTCCMEDHYSGLSSQLDYLPSVLWWPMGVKKSLQ